MIEKTNTPSARAASFRHAKGVPPIKVLSGQKCHHAVISLPSICKYSPAH